MGGSLGNLSEIPSSSQQPPSFSPIVPGVTSKPYIFNPHLPISFRPQAVPIGMPGFIGANSVPQLSLVGGGAHTPGPGVIFAGVKSWTDNPASQKPYFPVKVFSCSPPSAVGGSPLAKPQCPPLSPSPSPASHHVHLSPQSRSPVLPHSEQAESGHIAHHKIKTGTSESSSSEEEEITSPPPSHIEVVDSFEENAPHKIPPPLAVLPRSEEELFDERLDYGGENRMRKGFRSSSSSDSDSGGSCSSGPERKKRNKLRKRTAVTPRGSKSKSNGGKFRSKKCVGYRLNGRHSPQLHVAGGGELAGGGESIVLSLMSNYHVSMGEEPGVQTLPACPSLDKVRSAGPEGTLEGVSREKRDQVGGGGCGWLDDIIEKSVMSFESKFPELKFSPHGPGSLKTSCVQ